MARKPASEQGDTLGDVRAAAFRLFGRYGYDGVSMTKVGRAAGVTKAALYWHFGGKDELYLDCLSQLHAIFREHVFEPMARVDDAARRVLALFVGAYRLLQDPRISEEGIAGYWLEATTSELPEARRAQEDFERSAMSGLVATLDEATERGQLQLGLPVEDMAQAIVATLEAMVLPLRRMEMAEVRRLIASLAYTFFRAHSQDEALIADAKALTQDVGGVDGDP